MTLQDVTNAALHACAAGCPDRSHICTYLHRTRNETTGYHSVAACFYNHVSQSPKSEATLNLSLSPYVVVAYPICFGTLGTRVSRPSYPPRNHMTNLDTQRASSEASLKMQLDRCGKIAPPRRASRMVRCEPAWRLDTSLRKTDPLALVLSVPAPRYR